MINVSELVDDPDFSQPNGITIRRSTVQIVNFKPVETHEIINVRGIITVNNENIDILKPTSDINSESIRIVTYERLKTAGKDKETGIKYAADVVLYNGAEYIVRSCLDDTQYGFCHSTAHKMPIDRM